MDTLITVRGGTAYVSGLPEDADVLDALMAATSFRPAGYQYTVAFKKKRTDGRVKLFKNHKLPAGLVDTFVAVLDKKDVPYGLDFEQASTTKPDLPPMKLVGIESRWYQDKAVEAAILNPRGVIRAPTGSGKTAIGCRIVFERGKWALILVPTIDLLYQYKSFLEAHIEWLPGHGAGVSLIGQLGDGVVNPLPITVATVRTAANALGVAYEKYEYGEYDDSDPTKVDPGALKAWFEKIGTVIVDEAHILGAQSVYDITTKIPTPNKYGMSASPWRDDGADLMIEAATGRVIFEIPTKILVDDGFLVPPLIQVINTAGWWEPASWGQTCSRCGAQRPMTMKGPAKKCSCGNANWRSEFTDAYKREIVENAVRNWRIAEIVKKLDEPTLVLVKQIKHGKLLMNQLPGSMFLSGKDPGVERAAAYAQVKAGTLNTIIATTIADMGLDLPALTNLVLAGGGKSTTRHLQRIGRVARPFPGKNVARVIDFDDSHVHRWFRDHAAERRKIEKAEWGESALWI